MNIALARAAQLPAHEHDEDGLVDAMAAEGLFGVWCAWDDPAVRWADFDAVWIRTTWDYQWKLREFRAWVAEVGSQTRLFNPAPIVLWNLDKRYLGELEQGGIPIAPTVWLDPGDDPAVAMEQRGWSRGFLKPVVGANALRTLRFEADTAGLAAAREHCEKHRESMLLQPYLRSVEEQGEVSVVLADGKISHAVRKIPVAGDYRTQDDWGAVDQPLVLFHGEDVFAKRVMAVLQRRFDGVLGRRAPLVARVDTLRDDRDQLVLNELELIEPSLFFRHGPGAMRGFAQALAERLGE